ncbi:MAG: helix-turn-helix domain-containing protein [Reyranella sp.]|uniref:leucine zipper domain-containing protein n=1 Tax=Reyranella sp. TaxID=1929291 RepID=UPI0034570C0B|nr:helix-turn-helix domain-containing protein [Reyranella sp.]
MLGAPRASSVGPLGLTSDPWESRLDIHENARLTPLGRERQIKMLLSGQTPQAVGKAVGVFPRTVRKWVKRFEQEGLVGVQDRSSRPRRLPLPCSSSLLPSCPYRARHANGPSRFARVLSDAVRTVLA